MGDGDEVRPSREGLQHVVHRGGRGAVRRPRHSARSRGAGAGVAGRAVQLGHGQVPGRVGARGGHCAHEDDPWEHPTSTPRRTSTPISRPPTAPAAPPVPERAERAGAGAVLGSDAAAVPGAGRDHQLPRHTIRALGFKLDEDDVDATSASRTAPSSRRGSVATSSTTSRHIYQRLYHEAFASIGQRTWLQSRGGYAGSQAYPRTLLDGYATARTSSASTRASAA